MDTEEAIKLLEQAKAEIEWEYPMDYQVAIEYGIDALKQVQRYESQNLEDLEDPLEPLKIYSAFKSQMFVLQYRLKNKPKEVSILDYTILACLKKCLEDVTRGKS